MAIAFDAASGNEYDGSGTSVTVAHTCTGDNRILFAVAVGSNESDTLTSCTYNSASMTLIDKLQVSGDRWVYLFYLIAPATGTNNLTANFSEITDPTINGASYTGVSQTGQPDSNNTGTADSTTLTISTTTVADNCWLVMGVKNTQSTPVAGTGTTRRDTGGAAGILDSNGAKSPAGSYSLEETQTPSGQMGGIIASFSPAVVTSFIPTITIY